MSNPNPTNSFSVDQLKTEFDWIIRALKLPPATEEQKDWYVRAHSALFSAEDLEVRNAEVRAAWRAVELNADVEALEFVWRLRDRKNVITRKLHLAAYLYETEPKYHDLFHNHRQSWLAGFITLALLTVRSVGKLLKGRSIVHRVGFLPRRAPK